MKLRILLTIILIWNISFAQKQTTSVGFIENKGQIVDQKGRKNTAVLYLLNSQGLNVQLRKGGFSYDVYEVTKPKSGKKEISPLGDPNFLKEDFFKDKTEMSFHRIDIDFLNCSKNVSLKAEGKSSDYDNYYTAAHAPEGILYVHKFQKVTYENIYDKIDVVFFIPEDRSKAVEYNFIIHPGGKISDIQMKFNGAKTALSEEKIKMQVRFGVMEETLPLSWTETQGNREEVSVKYKKIRKDVYGFSSENFGGKTLIIDPVPIRLWGTYYGGLTTEADPTAIKTDSADNIIFAGTTSSIAGIATAGAFQTINTNYSEYGMLAKMDSNGRRLWGTYLNNGGTLAKVIDFTTNSSNEIYAVGYTFNQDNNSHFITTPGIHKEIGSPFSREGLVLKFNSNGERLWGTFYGGEGFDEIWTVCLDDNQDLLIAGTTRSTTGIITSGAYQSTNNDSFDGVGFFSKFTSAGQLSYGSYFPGRINYSSLDTNRNIIFAGTYTITSDQPDISTPGAHQRQTYNSDGFVAKFDSNYQKLWCTYFGGNSHEKISAVGTDLIGNVYLVGQTESNTNIATPGSHKPNNTAGDDAFIAKFNPMGGLLWGTYFGYDSNFYDDYCNGAYISNDGNIYIVGNTRNDTGIATSNGYQTVPNGSDEAYFAKFNTNGQQIWGTYYGGSFQEYAERIFYNNGIVYVLGYTTGSGNLGTSGTHQPYGGGYDYFLAKFRDCLSNVDATSNSPICINGDIRLTASGGTNYLWNGPNGFTSTLQNPIILNASILNNGLYTCSITGSAGCDNIINVNVVVGDLIAPVPDLALLPTVTGNCNTIRITTPTATDNCSGPITATTISPLTFSAAGTYIIVWNYKDANNNIASQNQTVIISSEPVPTVPANIFLCQNVSHLLSDLRNLTDIPITGQNIKWYDSMTGGNLLPLTTLLYNGTTYYASQTINGCESLRIPVSPTIQETPSPIGFAVQHFCDTQTLTLSDFVVTGTDVVFYDQRYGGTILPYTTTLIDSVVYWASQTINGCKSYVRLPMIADILNGIPANDFQTSLCDDLNDGKETVDLSIYNADLIVNPSAYAFSYYYSFNGATTENVSDKITDFQNHRLTAGINHVYVRIAFNGFCFKIVELKFNVIASPILNMSDKFSLCENSSVTVFPDSGFQYEWSTGSHATSLTLYQPGNYWVKATKNHGSFSCSTTKHFEVVLSNKATITKIDIKDWTSNDNMITVIVSGFGEYEYSIDGINFQDSNQFFGLASGEHTVYVNDKNGCLPASEKIYLLTYPKFFTPNNDGSNDYWKIKFSALEPGLSVKIFDRYGKFIKQLSNNTPGWDGTFNGETLPSTDYWFVVTRANGNEYRGHFSLKR